MSTQSKRSAKSILLGLFLDDPWRKLASIVLAVILWHYLDDQVSVSRGVDATLEAKGASEDLTSVEALTLVIRLDLQQYTVLGIRDARTTDPIRVARLTLSGPKHLVIPASQEAVFQVMLEPELQGERTVAEFDVTDIKAVTSTYQGLLVSMDPQKIQVELGRNVTVDISPSRDRIELEPPPNSPGFSQRLVWDDVRFDTTQVTIRGPASLVTPLQQSNQKLWSFAPPTPTPGQSQITQLLAPLIDDPRIRFEPRLVKISIPLRVVPREYRLEGVPVYLTEPPHLRGRFKLQRDTETVRIEAYKTLDGRLHGLTGEALQKWVQENAQIIATLPPDASGPDVIPRPRLLISEYNEGVDFRVTVLPTIRFDLKSP